MSRIDKFACERQKDGSWTVQIGENGPTAKVKDLQAVFRVVDHLAKCHDEVNIRERDVVKDAAT